MFEAFFQGLLLVFQWPAIGYLFLGIFIGIWLGAVPGIGGITGLVLLLPFTFSMEPVPAIALLLGMYSVITTGDTVSSVLLGIPGGIAGQATILDGYPLAQKGQAARAFGASFTATAYGGVLGAFMLALSLPILLPVILHFTSSELFMLGVLGLCMVGSLAGKSMAKGLAAAAFGLLLSQVGYAKTVAIPRYFFDLDYLLDGIPLAAAVLGLFGISEVLEMATRNTSIAKVEQVNSRESGLMQGVRDAIEHRWLATRSAAIGIYGGFMPGLGSAVVDWIAYAHALHSAKDKSQFGKGDIRGVIAPECANNAMRGGSLIPMVAFGIPESAGTAILMGALLIQGLQPGPKMLTTDLPVTFSIIWSIALANIFASLLLMVTTKQVAKLAFLPGHLMVPGIVIFIFMGAWLGSASLGDWVVCLSMGVLGFLMKQGGIPRPPLVLGFVLGPIMEGSFMTSYMGYEGFGWLGRPIVLGTMAFIVLMIGLQIRRSFKNKKAEPGHKMDMGEGFGGSALISLPLSIFFCAVLVAAGVYALQWPLTVRLFPTIATAAGAIAAMFAIARDIIDTRTFVAAAGGLAPAWASVSDETWKKSVNFLGYLCAMLVLTLVFGQKIALCVFTYVYLIRWGNVSWRTALIYTGCAWVFLVGFYDLLMQLFWYPSLVGEALRPFWPEWLPKWIFF